jgi:hypothetical protein
LISIARLCASRLFSTDLGKPKKRYQPEPSGAWTPKGAKNVVPKRHPGPFLIGKSSGLTSPTSQVFASRENLVGGTGKVIREAVPAAQDTAAPNAKPDGAQAVRAVVVPSPAAVAVAGNSLASARPDKVGEGEVPYPTGILKAGSVIKVTFSDGSIRGNGDPEFGGVRGNWVFAFGRWQPLRGSRHGEAAIVKGERSERRSDRGASNVPQSHGNAAVPSGAAKL